jgi:MarR family transcriptional regulator, transcriptional regulator for hemolysin
MRRDPPPVDLTLLLNQTSYALAERVAAALGRLGLGVRAYCALAKASEGDHTQRELAELAWMDRTTMVQTLDELEAGGLARRRLAPHDRRVRVVAVTPKGARLLARADRVVADVYEEVLAGVPAADRQTFLGVLEHLVEGPLAAPFHLEANVGRRRRHAS